MSENLHIVELHSLYGLSLLKGVSNHPSILPANLPVVEMGEAYDTPLYIEDGNGTGITKRYKIGQLLGRGDFSFRKLRSYRLKDTGYIGFANEHEKALARKSVGHYVTDGSRRVVGVILGSNASTIAMVPATSFLNRPPEHVMFSLVGVFDHATLAGERIDAPENNLPVYVEGRHMHVENLKKLDHPVRIGSRMFDQAFAVAVNSDNPADAFAYGEDLGKRVLTRPPNEWDRTVGVVAGFQKIQESGRDTATYVTIIASALDLTA